MRSRRESAIAASPLDVTQFGDFFGNGRGTRGRESATLRCRVSGSETTLDLEGESSGRFSLRLRPNAYLGNRASSILHDEE
jgi:hypothetical protein